MPEENRSNAVPADETLPAGGGSYVRHDDGSLEQVAGTQPALDRAHPEPGWLPEPVSATE